MNWKEKLGIASFTIVPGGLLIIGGYYLMTHCFHTKLTTPITIKGKDSKRFTYVVCLNCGGEFEYSLSEMKRGKRLDRNSSITSSR